MAELTREVEWFLGILQKEFGVEVSAEDVTVEAVELGKDEVDVFYLPIETIDTLPEKLIYELMVVDDDAQCNEWLGVIAFFPDSPEWCLQLITKNGQLYTTGNHYQNFLPTRDITKDECWESDDISKVELLMVRQSLLRHGFYLEIT